MGFSSQTQGLRLANQVNIELVKTDALRADVCLPYD
jgi:hypothetical protein